MNDSLGQIGMLLKIYGDSFAKTAAALRRRPWLFVVPYVYFVLFHLLSIVAGPLGMVGGFLMGLGLDAIFSSFLSLIAACVARERLDWSDIKQGFLRYFFDVMGLLFVLWLVNFVRMGVAAAGHGWLSLGIGLVIFILFNPIPELIYIGGYGTMELFTKAYEFIRENWIEWFIPNGILAGAFYGLATVVLPLPFEYWLRLGILGLGVMALMIFRGYLFQSLHRSSRRMRAFQMKAGF